MSEEEAKAIVRAEWPKAICGPAGLAWIVSAKARDGRMPMLPVVGATQKAAWIAAAEAVQRKAGDA